MKIIDWNQLDTAAQAKTLTRPAQTIATQTREAVTALIEQVRRGGDTALRDITARFDGVDLATFEVTAAELAAAATAVAPELQHAMQTAAARIEAFHRAGMTNGYRVETAPGVVCERLVRPIARVGLYVPAGSAPLFSTALMLGVPARLAGCREVVLCTPPSKDGRANPAVLLAARLTGVTQVFTLGGAQAIAAMAYGTASVPTCDKVFGPGNSFVTEAKQQLAQAGVVAIDMPAGPRRSW